MKILCSECGKEMEAEHREMSPGSNEECWVVQPCCDTIENAEELSRIKYELRDDILYAIDRLEDGLSAVGVTSKNVKDWLRQLNSLIKEI